MSVRLRALLALPAILASVFTAAVTTDAATAPAANAASHHHGHHHGHHHAHHAHHHSQHASHHAASQPTKILHARNIALQHVGAPYKWGATGPHAFDCSGLVYYSYRHAGLSVPRTAAEQSGAARHIPRSQMKSGDFLFFSNGSGVYHVAIFLHWAHGHAVMLHSPRPGERVQRSVPWTNSWFAGTLRGR